jgi:hypothetical protein
MTLHSNDYCGEIDEVNLGPLSHKTNLAESSKEACHSKGGVLPVTMKM